MIRMTLTEAERCFGCCRHQGPGIGEATLSGARWCGEVPCPTSLGAGERTRRLSRRVGAIRVEASGPLWWECPEASVVFSESNELRVVPDAPILLDDLPHREVALAMLIGKMNELALRHQLAPAGEVGLRMNVMLPAFAVDQGIDVDVPGVVAAEVVAQQTTSICRSRSRVCDREHTRPVHK